MDVGSASVGRRWGLVGCAAAVGVALWGCGEGGGDPKVMRIVSGPGLGGDRIETLYATHCAACHGTDSHGNGPAAEFLFPKPRAFKDSPLRFATSGLASIEQTIRQGVPRTGMPGFQGVLSDADIAGLAAYVNRMVKAEEVASGRVEEAPVLIPWRPDFTPGMVDYGASLYRSMTCVNCHGPTGRGDGAENVLDSIGNPVRPADLTSGVYKSGTRPEDLYRTIVQGVPGTPMPPYGKMLFTERQDDPQAQMRVWALVAYIQSLAPAKFVGAASGALARVQRVDSRLLAEPGNPGWFDLTRTSVALRPLWSRVEETLTMDVSVFRAGNLIGVRLTWADPTCDVHLDTGEFPDGVAIMFARGDEPPPLPMGIPLLPQFDAPPVNIWAWKASRQFDASSGERHDADMPRVLGEGRYHLFGPAPGGGGAWSAAPEGVNQDLHANDPAFRTAVAAGNIHSNPELVERAALEADAIGFGTLTYQPAELQDLQSSAVWANGHWFVTIWHAADALGEDDISFEPGRRIPIALAVWNGSKGDRDGIKLISGWHWVETGN